MKIEIRKVCTKKDNEKCPIPSAWEVTVSELCRARSKEEIESILRSSNRSCQLVNCPHLKDNKED